MAMASAVAASPAKVVSPAEWLAARKAFLAKEKEFTRLRDELSRQRRELPWEKVEKPYLFEGSQGRMPLAALFGKRSQLMIYHFMLGLEWEEGCKGCSFLADHFDGATIHLANRDVMLVAVSHAPLEKIEAFKKRMGWKFAWYSSFASDFNFDYRVSFTPEQMARGKAAYNYGSIQFSSEEAPGLSVFAKDESGDVFHTYSTYGRGLDILLGTYNFLDLAPRGRDEEGLAHPMDWLQHHDRYAESYEAPVKTAGSCCSAH
jgi:predicted dithiol-disulfide oxidoreductase (DUF899 family)